MAGNMRKVLVGTALGISNEHENILLFRVWGLKFWKLHVYLGFGAMVSCLGIKVQTFLRLEVWVEGNIS